MDEDKESLIFMGMLFIIVGVIVMGVIIESSNIMCIRNFAAEQFADFFHIVFMTTKFL